MAGHLQAHAINGADHTGFGDSVTYAVGLIAGTVAAGNHVHTCPVGGLVFANQPYQFGLGMAKADATYYYTVAHADNDAYVAASFVIPIAGLYSLRIIHGSDNPNDIAGALSAGKTAAGVAWATRQINLLNAHALTLVNALANTYYITDHALGTFAIGDYVSVLFAKTANDGAGNARFAMLALLRTA